MHENNVLFKTHVMFQSVPAVNIPLRATPGDLHFLLARFPGFFPKNFCPGFRSGQFFQKLIKIGQCFREAIKNLRKNACFRSQ